MCHELSSMGWVVRALGLGALTGLAGCTFSAGLTCDNARVGCPRDGDGASDGGNEVCDGDPTADPALVTDACGIFVSATAAAGGDGTRDRPLASLSDALAKANGKRVYACTAGSFAEAVTVTGGVEIIGGFDCAAGWTWRAEARSEIEAPPDTVALTITEAAQGASVQGFAITGGRATLPGGSSIGVVVADVEAALLEVDVNAGDGMDGAAGATPVDPPTRGADAPTSMDMEATDACVLPGGVQGGKPGKTSCEDGATDGGLGGKGGIPSENGGLGEAGADGVPLLALNPQDSGVGGQVTPTGACEDGASGGTGEAGDHGVAGVMTSLSIEGVSGGNGIPGGTGRRGQGGGGGGAAMAGLFCSVQGSTVEGPGASGGGGGAGGCGGRGGGGGQAGGSSIGIVSLGTRLSLVDVSVIVGSAGRGGSGVAGQSGAPGGAGAIGGEASGLSPSANGCSGGNGGQGGPGGSGGGGRGGHAVGIAFALTPDATPEFSMFTPGIAGPGGAGGPNTPPESQASAGVARECWDFSAGTACGG